MIRGGEGICLDICQLCLKLVVYECGGLLVVGGGGVGMVCSYSIRNEITQRPNHTLTTTADKFFYKSEGYGFSIPC